MEQVYAYKLTKAPMDYLVSLVRTTHKCFCPQKQIFVSQIYLFIYCSVSSVSHCSDHIVYLSRVDSLVEVYVFLKYLQRKTLSVPKMVCDILVKTEWYISKVLCFDNVVFMRKSCCSDYILARIYSEWPNLFTYYSVSSKMSP